MDLMFRNKGVDQTDRLDLPLFFLAFGQKGMDPDIDEPDLSEGSLEIGENQVMLPEIDAKT